MASTKDSASKVAFAALLLSNFAMTVNQTNIAAVYSLIATEFKTHVYGLGILTSAFFLAYAAFEIPGGIVATRIGPKKIVVIGTLLNAVGVVGSALSPVFWLVAVLRFIAGLGFAFAFPSILVLLVRNYREGSAGFAVSMMSISGAAGSVTALFGWALVADAVGWRPSVLISGAMDFAALAALILLVPENRTGRRFKINLGHLTQIVTNGLLNKLSLALFGIGATAGIVNYFMVYYLETALSLPSGTAGFISSISAILPIFSAPFIGRRFDRTADVRPLLLIPAALISFGVSLSSLVSVYASLATVVIVGIGRGMAFPVGLAAAREIASANPEYESLTVAWVDSFSLFGVFVAPLYYSSAVVNLGYPMAWLIGGAVAIVLTIPMITFRSVRRFGGSSNTIH